MKKITVFVIAALIAMTSCSKKSDNKTVTPMGLTTYTQTSVSGDVSVTITKDTSSGTSVLSLKVVYNTSDTGTTTYDTHQLYVGTGSAAFQIIDNYARATGDIFKLTFSSFTKNKPFTYCLIRQGAGNDTLVAISGR